ncbi:MAG: class I SAM-dependent methyltransferase [Syntrophaceae bacterium]|nr:class I SAM-dependent methyltransferase [Syntrophaceae bacterium]
MDKKRSPFLRFLLHNWPLKPLRWLAFLLWYRNSYKYKNHAVGINKHYGISNDFYNLFLDKKYMFYTCADFIKTNDSIEQAQDNKANYILKLIDPKPGEKILDLGCGWGPMMKKIYEKTGDKENIIGWTIAKEQIKYIREVLGFRVEDVNFCTTKFEENSWDKIFSIESLEAVRPKELLPLAKKLRKALKLGGRIVHQFSTVTKDPFSPLLIWGAFNIFPGSEITTIEKHMSVFEEAKFKIVHHSIHDYRPTLKAWFDRLAKNQNEAIRLVGVKTYNMYLIFFAGSHGIFQEHAVLLNRVILEPMD